MRAVRRVWTARAVPAVRAAVGCHRRRSVNCRNRLRRATVLPVAGSGRLRRLRDRRRRTLLAGSAPPCAHRKAGSRTWTGSRRVVRAALQPDRRRWTLAVSQCSRTRRAESVRRAATWGAVWPSLGALRAGSPGPAWRGRRTRRALGGRGRSASASVLTHVVRAGRFCLRATAWAAARWSCAVAPRESAGLASRSGVRRLRAALAELSSAIRSRRSARPPRRVPEADRSDQWSVMCRARQPTRGWLAARRAASAGPEV